MRPIRFLALMTVVLGLGLRASPPAAAQGVVGDQHELQAFPSSDSSGKLDRNGERLPSLALARFGSDRFRQEGALGIALAPDGKFLASASATEVRVWEIATGKEVPWLLLSSSAQVRVASIAFSLDGKELLTSLSNGRVQRWAPESGSLVGQSGWIGAGADGSFLIHAVSADQSFKASLKGGIIHLVRTKDGKRPHETPGHDGAILRLAVSPDAKTLASFGADQQLLLWNVDKAEVRQRWQISDCLCLAFSHDGKVLAIGEGVRSVDPNLTKHGGITLLDAQTGRKIHRFAAHDHGVYALAFSPDGKHLASAGADNRARLWDRSTWKELRQFTPRKPRDPERTANPWAVAFSPDGKILAACSSDDEEINLWSLETDKEPMRISRHWLVGFKADGKTLLAQNHFGHLALREVATGRELAVARTVGWLPAPDGSLILARASEGPGLILRDWAFGQSLLTYQGHRGKASAGAFTADGRTVFTGCSLGTILVWEVPAPPQLEMERLWNVLRLEPDKEAEKAINAFVVRPMEATTFLSSRVEAYGNKGATPARLIADLNKSSFLIRHQATLQLERLGSFAEEDVRAALKDAPSLEFRRRVERLLAQLPAARMVTPEERATLRTITVMERVATPAAIAVLRRLADGYQAAPITREAQAALDRLARLKK